MQADPGARQTQWARLKAFGESELHRTLAARRAQWAESRPRLKHMGGE